MNRQVRYGGWFIWLSIVVALMLSMVPLPDSAMWFWPQWTTLVVIYWCVATPARVGIGVGWLVGLLLDVAHGTLLGHHALGLAVVAFIAIKLHQRVRVFPLWQQALTVLVLVAMDQMLVLWVKGIIGTSPQTWTYWMPSLASMLVWPLVYGMLRRSRRRFRIA